MASEIAVAEGYRLDIEMRCCLQFYKRKKCLPMAYRHGVKTSKYRFTARSMYISPPTECSQDLNETLMAVSAEHKTVFKVVMQTARLRSREPLSRAVI